MRVAGEELRRDLERKGMQFSNAAVSTMEMQEVGVLIGGDHYWEIVFGKLDSKFGWLVQETVCLMYPQKQNPLMLDLSM